MSCNTYSECLIALLLLLFNQIVLFVIGVLMLIVGLTARVPTDVLGRSPEKILRLIKASEKLGLILRPAALVIITMSLLWGAVTYGNLLYRWQRRLQILHLA